jgi:hypothetical protein
MKKQILLTAFIFLIQLIVKSQVLDTITFEKHRELIKIDTSQKNNVWQIGRPQKNFFDSAYSKPYAIITDSISSYPVNNISSFTVIMPGPSNAGWSECVPPYIYFFQKFDMDSLQDSGHIDISTDRGITWKNIEKYCGKYYPVNITGRSNNWVQTTMNCNINFPICDTALMRFTFYSGSISLGKEGWMIDNIYIGYSICEGINEHDVNPSQINIYPNPSSQQVTLSYELPQQENSATLQLYNTMGQLVKTIAVNGYKGEMGDNVSALPNGIYYYTLVVNGTITETNKLVVIH